MDLSSGILRERSWRWLAARISGLLNKPPAIARLGDGKPHQIAQTRLGLALNPPGK